MASTLVKAIRPLAWTVWVSLGLLSVGTAAAQQPAKQPDAHEVLELIETNGNFAYATAAADMQAAKARLQAARAHLFPRPIFNTEASRYNFSQGHGRFKAAGPAGGEKLRQARNTVLLEGLAVFFGLHASELLLRSLNEDHSSAYVRWNRAKKQLAIGRKDPVKVAEWLYRVERTRLAYFRERSRNQLLRFRLGELTGLTFNEELIDPPAVPETAPPEIDVETLIKTVKAGDPQIPALTRRKEAVAVLRDDTSSGPERAELAAELGRLDRELDALVREMQYRVRTLWMSRGDSWQRIITARARENFTRKRLLQRQQLYQQDRVTGLGRAMIEATGSESELIRAVGAYYLDNAGLAVLLGENPARGLDPGFLAGITGGGSMEQYEPKGGSGFGQDDQNEVN